jgi:hypothetical protein
MVLQSDNGSEFIAEIVEKLMEIWPEAKIVYGQARPHSPKVLLKGQIKTSKPCYKCGCMIITPISGC